jgi:glycosidase
LLFLSIQNAKILHPFTNQFIQNMNFRSFITGKLLLMMVLSVLFLSPVKGQTITTNPALPTDATAVTIHFDATGTELQDYTGDVYAHTGVTIEGATNPTDNGRWKYVVANWETNIAKARFTRTSANTYTLELAPTLREYYGVPANLTITEICVVVRAADRSRQTRPDIFISLAQPGLAIAQTSPSASRPIYELDETVTISATANLATSLKLLIENTEVAQETSVNPATLELSHQHLTTSPGRKNFTLIAKGADQQTIEIKGYFFVREASPIAELPQGVVAGPNYLNNSSVTLVLHDPPALKNNVFVIGDFNNWELNEEHFMNRTPDGTYYWTTISNLTPDTEYGYQYYIDGELTIADPYTHKVLDPSNDKWIDEFNYPNLKAYPEGKTTGIVSLIHPARPEYQWKTTAFTPPAKGDLVIYELLIRDFVDTRAIKTVMDSLDYLQNLGVNVIGLMPINQFEGNNSWGYNPSFYFATDKAYGTINDYKEFIDECHSRGMAVTIDMVLNHSFGQSPLINMYAKNNFWEPSADNPWYNDKCPHEPWCWGADFDHDSPYTRAFVDRVNEFWLTEFKVDGFRFDFTKGFTNVQTGNQGSNYDAARIANLKRMADHIWQINPDAYVILEHFADNTEEKELANYGMMLWGNVTHNFQEAAMGYLPQSDFSWASYQNRGWAQPNLIAYMESHDEERIMFKNLAYGPKSGSYNVKDLATALRRAELTAAFYFTIPGPKMIWQFGELGYDYSINHCGDAPVNPVPPNLINPNDPGRCRTDLKPIRWDYYDDWRRKRLYDVHAMLIDLKKEHEVFSTTDYTLTLGGANPVKRIHLNHSSNQVTLLGNFGITEASAIPNFQTTGTWYEYFSRQSINVTNTTDPIVLQPGEYRLYSAVQFPDHGISLGVSNPGHTSTTRVDVFPNPSQNGFTFNLETNSTWNIRIMNVQGQVVFQQSNLFGPTHNQFYWNSQTREGNKAPTGIYFYNLYTHNESLTGKIMVR